MNKLKKIILPFSIFILVVVLAGVFFANSKSSKSAFGVVNPQRGNIAEQLRFSGKVQAQNTFDLGFEKAGKIVKIYVAVGDKVKKGQLLAELNPQDASISYAQALADKNVTRSQLEQAQKNKDIQEAKLKSVKQSDTANKYDKNAQMGVIDQSQAAIDAQQALLQKADETVKNSSLQLSKTKLYAPVDGIITKQSLEPGEIVSAYAPVISLSSDSTLEIQAYVSEIEVAKISLGDKVQVKLDSNQGENLEASVATIDPAETNVSGVATYKVTFTPAFALEKIKSGMAVELTLSLAEKKDVLIVPAKSVFQEAGKAFVLTIVNDSQVKKEVQLGAADQAGNVQVLSGIGEQDGIVSFNSTK